MSADLRLLRAVAIADIRKAWPSSFSGPAVQRGALVLIVLFTFSPGILVSLLFLVYPSPVPLVFDFHLLILLTVVMSLFPEGFVAGEERAFLFLMRGTKRAGRRLEFVLGVFFGGYLALALSLPPTVADYCAGRSWTQSCFLFLICVGSGLTVCLGYDALHHLPAIRNHRIPPWVLNGILIAVVFSSMLVVGSGDASAGRSVIPTPGVALQWMYMRVWNGPWIVAGAATLICVGIAAILAMYWGLPGSGPESGPGLSARSKPSLFSRCLLACESFAGRNSYSGFFAAILTLYLLRTRYLNLIFLVGLAVAWSPVLMEPPVMSDEEFLRNFGSVAVTVPALLYAGIAFKQDRYLTVPPYLHCMNVSRMSLAGARFSSLLAGITMMPPVLLAMAKGTPPAVALRGAAWLMLSSFACHALMQIARSHLPLSRPIGKTSSIFVVACYLIVCQLVAIASSQYLNYLPREMRSLHAIVIFYAVVAGFLDFAARRIAARRMRYLYPSA